MGASIDCLGVRLQAVCKCRKNDILSEIRMLKNIQILRYHFQSHNLPRLLQYSTAIPSLSSSSTDCIANYLVDSLGISHHKALSTSSKLSQHWKVNDFNFHENAICVVTFFRYHGFDDTHIRKMVCFHPRLLLSNVENTLLPKLQIFKDLGFSGSDIIRVFSANPNLLKVGVESCISPSIQILRDLLGCDSHVIDVLKKLHCRNFGKVIKHSLLPNVALLDSYGFSMELIKRHLVCFPGAFVVDSETFKGLVIRVEQKLGITPDSTMFLYGIRLAYGLTDETIQSKCQVFKSFGWTESDVRALMMKNPTCFGHSEANLKKKLDFLVNVLRLNPAYLASNINLFTCSLEKRVVPRHKVLLTLKEKGLLENIPALSTAMSMSESRFLNECVIPFKEVHQVYVKHTGCSIKMLTQERAEDIVI